MIYLYFFIIFCVVILLVIITKYISKKCKCKNKELLNKLIDYEKENNSKILFIIDKDEIDIDLDYFSNYIIDIDDSSKFQNIYNKLIENNIKKLDICVESHGGNIQDSDIIIHNLLNYKYLFNGKINTFVPYKSYSAGTLISLCGDEIFMNHSSVLGPCDPIICKSVNEISVNSYLKYKSEYENIDENTILKMNDYEKLYNENINLLTRIFKNLNKKKLKKKIIKIFGSGNFSHDSSFTSNYLKKLGINIKVKKNDVFDLFDQIKNKN